MTNVLYYESHVTVDPVEDGEVDDLKEVASRYGFRVAKLLMRKGLAPSTDDAFMTARSQDSEDIRARTAAVVEALLSDGFGVRRYKVEEAVVDSNVQDDVIPEGIWRHHYLVRQVDGRLLSFVVNDQSWRRPDPATVMFAFSQQRGEDVEPERFSWERATRH